MREPALRGAANLWIVSDPISRADAIVVLGGGLETRPFIAAEMWRRGLADKILISQSPEKRAVAIGVMPSHSELMAYHSFGGEVEASSTPTIRRLTPHAVTNFRGNQRPRRTCALLPYMRAKRSPPPTRWTRNARAGVKLPTLAGILSIKHLLDEALLRRVPAQGAR